MLPECALVHAKQTNDESIQMDCPVLRQLTPQPSRHTLPTSLLWRIFASALPGRPDACQERGKSSQVPRLPPADFRVRASHARLEGENYRDGPGVSQVRCITKARIEASKWSSNADL